MSTVTMVSVLSLVVAIITTTTTMLMSEVRARANALVKTVLPLDLTKMEIYPNV